MGQVGWADGSFFKNLFFGISEPSGHSLNNRVEAGQGAAVSGGPGEPSTSD